MRQISNALLASALILVCNGTTADASTDSNPQERGGGDNFVGTASADLYKGTRFMDSVAGRRGADTLHGRRGMDLMTGSQGRDLVAGGRDSDLLVGESGRDTISGGRGGDVVIGDQGSDLISGGPGADLLEIADGRDSVHAGRGPDLVKINNDDARDHIACGAGADLVIYAGGRDPMDRYRACEAIYSKKKAASLVADGEVTLPPTPPIYDNPIAVRPPPSAHMASKAAQSNAARPNSDTDSFCACFTEPVTQTRYHRPEGSSTPFALI